MKKNSVPKLNVSKLRMLSPDNDDWDDLISKYIRWPNMENSLVGVLLYPRKGISESDLETLLIDYIGSIGAFANGGLDNYVTKRGNDWAFVYQVHSWYNHFDLDEEYD